MPIKIALFDCKVTIKKRNGMHIDDNFCFNNDVFFCYRGKKNIINAIKFIGLVYNYEKFI